MYHEWPCGQWRQVAAATLGTSNRIRNVAAMIHRHATFRIQPVRLNGITRQRNRRGGNLPPATFRIQPVRMNETTYRHVIPSKRSESRNLPKLQVLSCVGPFPNVVDSSAPLTRPLE